MREGYNHENHGSINKRGYMMSDILENNHLIEFLPYNSSSIGEIKHLFTNVFSDSEGESEGLIIGSLVYNLMTETDAQDLYGFIALENAKIIGSIFFTRLTFESNVTAFLLSPVAVHTNYQGKGIGQKLINYGMLVNIQNDIELVFTYGDPKFYSKIGFSSINEKFVKAPFTLTSPEGWLGQSLVNDEIEPIPGDSCCVAAFNKPGLW